MNALRCDIGLNVVGRGEYEAAAGSHDLKGAVDILFNHFRAGEGEYLLHVNATAPEAKVMAELLLKGCYVHLGRATLYGVKDVQTNVNKIPDDVIDRAAGM
jgi:hypothetical protein